MTDKPVHPVRRAEDQGWPRRAWEFVMAPVVDDYRGLSLTRFIAVALIVMVGHEVFVHERALTWIDFWVALAAIATAFGKSAFTLFLHRVGLASASQDVTQTVDVTLRQIQERRAHPDAQALGAEVT